MPTIYSQILDKLISLYQGYSQEHRFSTQPVHLEKVRKLVKNYRYDCYDPLIREPLIEHIGILPIVTTTIFPHIKDDSVNLGKALIMLAIHDIGELVTGDEMVFTKNRASDEKEKIEALKLLPVQYHSLYLDMEEQKTSTGKFAKAIDKITPDIIDLITPANITIERYKTQLGDKTNPIAAIKMFKHKYMIWNDFMKKLHLEILKRLDQKLNS